MPLAFDSPILVVVVALLEVALCVSFTAGHGTNRQHTVTLTLFEIRGQPVGRDAARTQRGPQSMDQSRLIAGKTS